MTVAPNRNSLIRLLVKVWVSVIPPKRSRKGMSSGKFKLFAEATPPVWIWKESAPKGKNCSESVQKKRKEKRSLLPRDSLSQLVVNWLSVNLPGELTRSEEHTSELQSQSNLVCRLLLEKNICEPSV